MPPNPVSLQGMVLHRRTASTRFAPSSVKQPHIGPSGSRTIVRVHASLLNPHSILGVSPTADVKEVKRAYRKLALQFHPDVCKSEDGHERFLALTQAYEMLLGRAEGKTDPNHASSSGWDFHDWYWNFRMQRSWEKQQRQAKAAAAAAAGADMSDGRPGDTEPGCGRRAPPHGHAGYKQPEARANLRSQLAGLRHRAAVRANRPSASAASSTVSSPSPASSSASPPASCSAASGFSMDAEDAGPWTAVSCAQTRNHASRMEPISGAGAGKGEAAVTFSEEATTSESKWSWSWSWDEILKSEDEQLNVAGVSAARADASSSSNEGQSAQSFPSSCGDPATELHHQYTHVYKAAAAEGMVVHDGHLGTIVGAANHAVPFPSGASVSSTASKQQYQRSQPHQTHDFRSSSQQDQSLLSGLNSAEPEPEPETETEPEPFSNPFDKIHFQQQHSTRRSFSADNASRESVSHQLAGLRRKAAMKATHYSTGTGTAAGAGVGVGAGAGGAGDVDIL
ncbi:hypothetical protein VaNZ11_016525 [Volvox africanus]|uniref:J domain-containing protein n=1 Tax=Volvox africanus TaxID=51714 RepID=A0ABQ5SN45_9CHLO|nr:hypothetical protein VaNZ11_016525 [Volvox africanus]